MDQAERDFERARGTTRRASPPRPTTSGPAPRSRPPRAGLRSRRENRVEQIRAGLNASRDTLSKTTVRAPIDGVVTTLRVKAGEVTVIGTMNNPGTQLMTISDMSSVHAVLMVDETDMPERRRSARRRCSRSTPTPAGRFDGVVTEVGHSPIPSDDADLQGLTTTSDAINFKVQGQARRRRRRASGPASRSPPTSSPAPGPKVPAVPARGGRHPRLAEGREGRLRPAEDARRASTLFEDGKAALRPRSQTGITGELMVEVTDGPRDGAGDRHRSVQGPARDQGRRPRAVDVREGEEGRGEARRSSVSTPRMRHRRALRRRAPGARAATSCAPASRCSA